MLEGTADEALARHCVDEDPPLLMSHWSCPTLSNCPLREQVPVVAASPRTGQSTHKNHEWGVKNAAKKITCTTWRRPGEACIFIPNGAVYVRKHEYDSTNTARTTHLHAMHLRNSTRCLGARTNHRRASLWGDIEDKCVIGGSPVGAVSVKRPLVDLS